MKYVALMPLRGGSKSIPYKNLKLLAGKPLFFHALSAAINSDVFERVFVSTEDPEIERSVREWCPEVQIIRRPMDLASDTASTESVMLHFASQQDFDVLCLIQATSPLTQPGDFAEARVAFEKAKADSLLTAVEVKRFFWTSDGKPINYDPNRRPRRQEFAPWLMENGAFYLTRRDILLDKKNRLGGRILIHIMHERTSLEIDEPSDWDVVESLIHQSAFHPRLASIRAVVVDVDGTLTDGGMYYSSDGEFAKKFDTRDWHGMRRLMNDGVRVAIMTTESSQVVHARFKKAPVSEYHFGVDNKLELLERLTAEWNISLAEVAYVGDDLGDLECMKRVGFAACPRAAAREIRALSHLVVSPHEGLGAVRVVCDAIMQARELARAKS